MPDKKNLTNKKNRKKKNKGGKVKRRTIRRGKRNSKKDTKPEKLKPEDISKILSDIHILLSFPSVEFLPSSNIFSKNNTGHYLQMIDYQDLASIINQNPNYKKSPTIQKIFNYNSYRLENRDEIVFNYQNIKCDNLIIKEQKNYNVKLLFLYLLECNISERLKEILQVGGDEGYDLEKMIEYDVEQKKDDFSVFEKEEKEKEREKELERVRELEREKYMERKRLEEEMRKDKEQEEEKRDERKKEDFEEELNEQTEKVIQYENRIDIDEKEKTIQKEINEERKVLNEIKEYHEELDDKKDEELKKESRLINAEIEQKDAFEKEMMEEERKLREKLLQDRMEMEKKIEIKVKGFEEFLENKKVSNISKNSFAVYNVNWFNVCCGFEKYDDAFEEEVKQNITDMGLIINEEQINDKLLQLFEDKRELFMFKNMIKNRLIDCSEIEPPSFFEKLFTNSFGTFKKCDERSPQSLLYLYKDYQHFLERENHLTKLEKVLLLIYCETRQHLLSKYLSLEIIRKENDKKRKEKIISILDKIMKSDKSIIRKNDKILEKEMKLKYKEYKDQKLREAEERNRVKGLVSGNNIIIQKNKIRSLMDEKEFEEPRRKEGPGIFDKLKDLFSKNADGPSFDLILTPKEREAYQKAMKKMKGGGELIYKTTDDDLHKTCDKIKKEKNIYKHQLDLINGC